MQDSRNRTNSEPKILALQMSARIGQFYFLHLSSSVLSQGCPDIISPQVK